MVHHNPAILAWNPQKNTVSISCFHSSESHGQGNKPPLVAPDVLQYLTSFAALRFPYDFHVAWGDFSKLRVPFGGSPQDVSLQTWTYLGGTSNLRSARLCVGCWMPVSLSSCQARADATVTTSQVLNIQFSSIQVSKPIETKSRPTYSKPHAHINISHTTSFCKKEENVVVGVGVSLIGGGDILGDRMLHS